MKRRTGLSPVPAASVRRLPLPAIVLLALLLGGPLPAQENFLHQSVRVVMLVADAEQAAERIEGWAEARGGYLLYKSVQEVRMRLPHAQLPALRDFLEELSEDILEYSPQAADLRESYFATESALRSRQEILTRNQSLLDQADVAGTLAIEREMITLIEQVEKLQGTLQKLAVDRFYARVEIALQYQATSLPDDLPSSFDWINQVSFYDFIREGL